MASISDVGFEERGFLHLTKGIGYVKWFKLVNVMRDRNKWIYLTKYVMDRLWAHIVVWYFVHWVPPDAREKTQKALDKALAQPEKYKDDWRVKDSWTIRKVCSDTSFKDLAKHWEGENLEGVTKYLDQKALEFPETFGKDRVPIHEKKKAPAEPESVVELRKQFKSLSVAKKRVRTTKRVRNKATGEGSGDVSMGGIGEETSRKRGRGEGVESDGDRVGEAVQTEERESKKMKEN